ncbi:MAG: PDZ domain-containing protein, partial [Planctomycetes bacterium]|nr:PDZ domain-containing protein [Planctomycetota bacterium]
PLVNLDGEVIGINTAISSSSGGNQGVGFAVPVNLAKWVSRQLMADGSVHRAQLGVMIQPLTHELAEQFGLEPRDGVLVADISADTPAAKAGLKPGDVIVDYDGQTVSSPRELQAAVERSEVGEKHEMVVLRDGKRQTLRVIPREQPADEALGRARSLGPGKAETSRFEKLGIEAETLTPDVAEHLNVKAGRGVVITDVRSGSAADRAGLAAGMVIVEANRKPVETVADLRASLGEADDRATLLLVRSEQGSRFIVLRAEY